jgi:hypothetical protein
MKTNYYIGVPLKNNKKICFFLCVDNLFVEYYSLEDDKNLAMSFSTEESAREWIENYYPFPNDNRKNNPVWTSLSKAEKENFDWDKYYILKETWEVIES